mmetsp:Transcript_18549/g.51728  ORF Transcript_18549/g.51728 Transcript_18549/m.51728 type:complete len:244 (+) Transcript_18549:858-1589(+)
MPPAVLANAFVANGRLLVCQHPGHDDSAYVGRHQLHELGLVQRESDETFRHAAQLRRSHEHSQKEGNLADAHCQAGSFCHRVAARRCYTEQRQADSRIGSPYRNTPEGHRLPDNAELRQQAQHTGRQQGRGHEPCGDRPHVLPEHGRHAHASDDAQARGELLCAKQDRHKGKLQRQQCVAPLCAGLCGSEEAGAIRVGQAGHQAGAHDGQHLPEPRDPTSIAIRNAAATARTVRVVRVLVFAI